MREISARQKITGQDMPRARYIGAIVIEPIRAMPAIAQFVHHIHDGKRGFHLHGAGDGGCGDEKLHAAAGKASAKASRKTAMARSMSSGVSAPIAPMRMVGSAVFQKLLISTPRAFSAST